MNIMLDLETLDVGPAAVMLSIGMVAFDEEKIHDRFYSVPDMQMQMNEGRTVSASTILWWMQQSSAAQQVFEEQRKSPEHYYGALTRANEFITKYKNAKIYSLGSEFDCVILGDAFLSKYSPTRGLPWHWGRVRCFRTWCEDHDAKYRTAKDPRVAHHALQDAEDQALHMINTLNPKPKPDPLPPEEIKCGAV